MYIREITLSGFKSYLETNTISELSPGHNVILGKNGSGKSNIFAAIRFVMGDLFSKTLRKEERQAVLHGTAGSSVPMAYAEIVFDNTDHRFPINTDAVKLKRVVTASKDEYSLNDKPLNKLELENMLNSAGFPLDHSHFIVPQGKIMALATARDEERLAWLKDVAGTRTYEGKRLEAMNLLEMSTDKMSKIDQMLNHLSTKIVALESEKQELSEYLKKDRDRRFMEFVLFQRELDEIKSLLAEVDSEKSEIGLINETIKQTFLDREDTIADYNNELEQMKNRLESLKLERQDRQTSLLEIVQGHAKAEMMAEDLSLLATSPEDIERELASLDTEIAAVKSEIDSLPLEHQRKILESQKSRLESQKAQLLLLENKISSKSCFASKSERDAWLNSEIEQIQKEAQKRLRLKAEIESDIQVSESRYAEIQAELKTLNTELQTGSSSRNKLQQSLEQLKLEVRELDDRRKHLWREESILESSLATTTQNFQGAQRSIVSGVDYQTSEGISHCRRIASSSNFSPESYFGPLFELFTFNEKYKTCIDVVAGNSLFNIVVDNDETATRILSELKHEKRGRVTFIPLDSLKNIPVVYPESDDCIPLISKLRFDPKIENAMHHVFARSVICPDIDTCYKYSKSHKLNAMTLQGDRADPRGFLTGGYIDKTRSRAGAIKVYNKYKHKLDEDTRKLKELQQNLEIVKQQHTQKLGEAQKLEIELAQFEVTSRERQQSFDSVQKQIEEAQEYIEAKKRILADLDQEIENDNKRLESSQKELSRKFDRGVSDKERHDLDSMREECNRLESETMAIEREFLELDGRHKSLVASLTLQLAPKKFSLERRLELLNSNKHKLSNKDDQQFVEKLNSLKKQLKEADKDISNLNADIEMKVEELHSLQQKQIEDAVLLEREEGRYESEGTKQQLLLSQKLKAEERIATLGILPEEAHTKYQRTSSENLLVKLHKLRASLSSFSNLNNKALDYYANFKKEHEKLTSRRNQLVEEEKEVRSMIEAFDLRNESAFKECFEQVAIYFKELFSQLLPELEGELRLVCNSTQSDADIDEGHVSDFDENDSLETLVHGVTIDISLASQHTYKEARSMEQLSGGQRSLAALAIIFALQRTDPAPFYVFDEIDANLDPEHRQSLARVLNERSKHAQIICTTFKKEQIEICDSKCYFVSNSNGRSFVAPIDHQQAITLADQIGQ